MTELLNEAAELLWGGGMILLMLGVGLIFTIRGKGLQFNFKTVFRETIGQFFFIKRKSHQSSQDELLIRQKQNRRRQFRAAATALAASMGTGNIVGVASALTLGGPGAIFWMWISAVFGSMTAFSENLFGIYYQYKNRRGFSVTGPMASIERGLGQPWLAAVYAFFCVCTACCMGNMAQSNAISQALEMEFQWNPWITGICLTILLWVILLGGGKWLSKASACLIPAVSVLYIGLCIFVIVANASELPGAFANIIEAAFGWQAATGGITGALLKRAVSVGFRRGVFSNEAGLGTSAIAHAVATEEETCDRTACQERISETAEKFRIKNAIMPNHVRQGYWAVFEIILDTLVCCTVTALTILVSGVQWNGAAALSGAGDGILDGTALVIASFETVFGSWAGILVTVAILLFALATMMGWGFYGLSAWQYLMKGRGNYIFVFLFPVCAFAGAMGGFQWVWSLCDIFNGLMAVPNLICLFLLQKQFWPVFRMELKIEN